MLHGVLNMPPDCWCGSPIDVMQRHSRYVEASKRIVELERELAEARKQIEANHKGVEMLERMVYEAREQRDTLKDTIKKMLYGEGDSVHNLYKIGSEALAAVKGENQ